MRKIVRFKEVDKIPDNAKFLSVETEKKFSHYNHRYDYDLISLIPFMGPMHISTPVYETEKFYVYEIEEQE